MKKNIILFLIVILSFNFNSFAKTINYIPGINDLPAPQGFTLKAGSSNIFDVKEGKIVDAIFEGKADKLDIIAFYRQTLPPLGWDILPDNKFERNGEILKIDLYEDIFSGGTQITYQLRPKKAI